jgi:hypothetical protein
MDRRGFRGDGRAQRSGVPAAAGAAQRQPGRPVPRARLSRGSSRGRARWRCARRRLDLLAQAVHVHLDGVVADFLAPFAQVVDERPRHEPADALQQHFEQPELARESRASAR